MKFLSLRLATLLNTWSHMKSTVMGLYVGDRNGGSKRKEGETQLAVSLRSESYNDHKFDDKEVHQAKLNVVSSHSLCVVSSDVLSNETKKQKSKEPCLKKQLQESSDKKGSIEIIQLKNRMSILQKEFMIVSDWVRLLRNENNTLKMKVTNTEKVKKAFDASMKEKVKNLEQMLEDKNNQVENLWGAIQMIDDKNIKLRGKEDAWKSSEQKLKHEIKALKMTVANNCQKTDFYVSPNTANWKEKMDKEFSASRAEIQTSVRKKNSSSRSKLRRWTKRRMRSLKYPHENGE